MSHVRISLLLSLVALAPAGCSKAARINGGGASFIYPLILMWTRDYDAQFQIQIDYQSTGSGNGQQQTIARTIDFGCTDAPINDANLKKAESNGGPMLHVPLVMGGVVPVYNVHGIGDDMRFTGELIADIHEKSDLCRRANPSGTMATFTDYLSKVTKETISKQ